MASIRLATTYQSPSGQSLPPGEHLCCASCREELREDRATPLSQEIRDEVFHGTDESPNRHAMQAMAENAVSVRLPPAIDMSIEEERDQQIRIAAWLNETDPSAEGKLPGDPPTRPLMPVLHSEAKRGHDPREAMLASMGVTPFQFRVLTLRFAGHTNGEISAMLNVTANMCDKGWRKGLAKLPAHMRDRLRDQMTGAIHQRRRLISITELGAV